MNKEEKNTLITNEINLHGIFFKKAVRHELEKIPQVTVIGEEYPVSYLQGTALDLLIEVKTKNNTYILPVECKRAYTIQKNWVFFYDAENTAKLFYVFEGSNLQYITIKNSNFPICIEGIEVDIKQTKGTERRKTDPTPIWKAAAQIITGTHGFVMSELNSRTKKSDQLFPKVSVLSMIITNAPLQIYEAAIESIDITTGNYTGEMNIREVECLILSHPFTSPSGFRIPKLEVVRNGYVEPKIRGMQEKEGVLVINSKYLHKLVDVLP